MKLFKRNLKFILSLLLCSLFLCPAFAENQSLARKNDIQNKIDDVGTQILNANKIPKRIIFVYNEKEKKEATKLMENLSKRQIIVYQDVYNSIQNDDDLAAMLSREISIAVRSYSGKWGGRMDSLAVIMAPKKFQLVADKRAVDYLVNANYNPLALIVYLNKTCPQNRTDKISRLNLTSKRLASIYEYITLKYPKYLNDEKYLNNKFYQNFLLTSVGNRSLLKEKIRTGSTKAVKYE